MVRNLEELGPNLQKIQTRIMSNQNLLKLLYYTDKDPLSHEDLTAEQKKKEIFEKLVKIIPRVGPKETAQSIITMRVISGDADLENNEFKIIRLNFEVFVPLTQWIIKDESLRPFCILGELQKTLKGKTIDGMGQMMGGDFSLNFLTEEISCYEMSFQIIQYD